MHLSPEGYHEGIRLAFVDERSVSHEYAAIFFMPAGTQAIAEGSAEMVAAKTLGYWALPIDYPTYQNHNWQQELWWDQSGSYQESPEKTIWGKITLAGQAFTQIERKMPGISSYLGDKNRDYFQQHRRDAPVDVIKKWVEGKWSDGWKEFQEHPILFTPEGHEDPVDLKKYPRG